MKKYNLWVYVVAVVVVLAVMNSVVWWIGGDSNTREVFSAGFAVGMLAMYIATRVYKN